MPRDSPYEEDAMSPLSETELTSREKLLARRDWQGDLEDDQLMGVPSRKRGVVAFLSRWRWLLDTTLLLIILGLLLERQIYSRTPDVRVFGSDITGFAPKFTSQITTFTASTKYIPDDVTTFITNTSIKRAWLDLVPPGLGYIDIKPLAPEAKAALHDLPTPLTGYPTNQTIFTTSVTHQLHCLYSIIHGYASAKSGVKDAGHGHRRRDDAAPDATAGEELVDEGFHMQHCFEYLRQAIMCSGDVALEGDQTTFPEGSVGSDGWDAKHVCRDWDQVYDYLKENRANDDVWIA